jgi:mevalonate kinase
LGFTKGNILKQKRFYSKVLLFGEHTVNIGSQALAMPLDTFGGAWSFDANASQYRLREWCNYLIELQRNSKLLLDMKLEDFATDLSNGLCFVSDVPQGYGAGSSGALCAAAYDRYKNDRDTPTMAAYKQGFAQLESFFHGTSSGIDPLVCFINQPLLIVNKDMVTSVVAPMYIGEENGLFLLDTGITREASVMIKYFLQKSDNEDFMNKIKSELVVYNNLAINAFLEGHWPNLMKAAHNISAFQYEYLDHLIPSDYRQLWQKCLDSTHTKLKICGAGGGGFILGITSQKSAVKAMMKDQDVIFFF